MRRLEPSSLAAATLVILLGVLTLAWSGRLAQGSSGPSLTTTAQPASPTPEATPTLALSARPVPDSGLFQIELDTDVAWAATGVSVDGDLRAVVPRTAGDAGTGSVSVWVPPGLHEVCVGEVSPGTQPEYWGDGDVTAPPPPRSGPGGFSGAACTMVEGQVDVPASLFPENRVVAYYGVGITPALGVLGEGTPEESLERVVEAAAEFDEFGLPTLPAFEFIATVAQGQPGGDGTYSLTRPEDEIRTYLEQIRSVGGILVLDFQPGRGKFLEQIRQYESLLLEPDVHLALDPEWSMAPGQVPGRVVGSTHGDTVNEILDYVQGLVVRHGLPEKLVLVHQFTASMVHDRETIADPPGVAVTFHMDGQGEIASKYRTYDDLSVDAPFFNGFKVFFDEDSRLLSPAEIMALDPAPLYVSYQ
ncbi:MAG: hypothetical protein ACC660_03035 [Acidimicrobiales bacterium]